ncbi:hypothetical protein Ocin01_08365 [Orchesella cincta]|uniref:Uncharacterized protein n=1 Tax=Orchesella cincta TaxID=48709 RepID=A0A1D2N094_ORCCI|nr:hypothetical protein Ocin01_08365 [Orchesella cincta]
MLRIEAGHITPPQNVDSSSFISLHLGTGSSGTTFMLKPTGPHLRLQVWNTTDFRHLELWWDMIMHYVHCHTHIAPFSLSTNFSSHEESGNRNEIMESGEGSFIIIKKVVSV